MAKEPDADNILATVDKAPLAFFQRGTPTEAALGKMRSNPA